MATSVTVNAATTLAVDLRRDEDFSTEDILRLLELTGQVKRNPARFAHALSGRYLALLFEKPSLRTRLTFEAAINTLGGSRWDSQLVYSLSVSPSLMLLATSIACGIGIIGGLLPAIRAIKTSVADSLRMN